MHTLTGRLSIDPTSPTTVRIHPEGIATYLDATYGGVDLTCDHWRGDAHTPEALVAWLRATADAVEQAWAERTATVPTDDVATAAI